MKLLDESYMSYWAYSQCCQGNDTEEIRNLITASYFAYRYCETIKDREDVRKK